MEHEGLGNTHAHKHTQMCAHTLPLYMYMYVYGSFKYIYMYIMYIGALKCETFKQRSTHILKAEILVSIGI